MNAVMKEVRPELDLAAMPQPMGWRILVLPYVQEMITPGGIVIPEEARKAEETLTCVGEVIAMGELCYTHERFAVGERDPKAWCNVGDFVVYSAYSGQRFRYQKNANGNDDIELLILNDDEVKMVTPDPTRVKAYV